MKKNTIEIDRMPLCDLCAQEGIRSLAKYDGKTIYGSWAYMCERHFKEQKANLGLGKGQELIMKKGNKK